MMKNTMRYSLFAASIFLLATRGFGQTTPPVQAPTLLPAASNSPASTWAPASAGVPAPAPAGSPEPQRGGDIPRQLTLERAQELLIRNNLAIIASRYGVDIARAQRLLATLNPNPILSVIPEQLSLTNPSPL